MLSALTFEIKRSWLVLTMLLMAVALSRVELPLAETATVVLVWLLFYRLLVEEKSKKTWEFFHSLPLSLPQRAVIKMVLPLLVALLALALSEVELSYAYLLEGGLTGHLLLVSILLLAALRAQSIGQYILLFWLIYLPALLFSIFSPLGVAVAGLALGVAYAFFAQQRLSVLKAGALALCVALPLGIGAAALRLPAYRFLMQQGTPETRAHSALVLLAEASDETARAHLEQQLREAPTAEQLARILDAFQDADVTAQLSVAEWEALLDGGGDAREELLEYFSAERGRYPWLTAERAVTWEARVLVPEAKQCHDDCAALADLVSELHRDRLWDHFAAHLDSGERVRVRYSLRVVEEADQPVLLDHLMPLLADPRYSEEVVEILSDWTDEKAEDEVDRLLEQVDQELAPARAARLEEFFRRRLQ